MKESEATPLLCEEGNRSEESCNRAGNIGRQEEESYAETTWWKKPSVYWLLPPFFLYAMAVGGVLVSKLNLILYLSCRNYLIRKFPNDPTLILPVISGKNPQCQIPEIQSLSVEFTLYMTIVTGILSAFISPRLGTWSDRYGRLGALTVVSFGALVADLLIILLANYPDTLNYRWLLLSSLIDGVCGSFTAGFAITHAYAADCTAPLKRAMAFGYFHASLFLGIAIGPLLAALLVAHTHSLVSVFYAAVSFHFFFIIIVSLIIPESLTKERRQRIQAKYMETEVQKMAPTTKLNIFRYKLDFISPFRIFFPRDPNGSFKVRINLICLSFIDAIVTGITLSATTVTISTINICRFCALLFIPRACRKIFRAKHVSLPANSCNPFQVHSDCGSYSLELLIIRSGVFFETLGYIGFATAWKSSIFVLAGIVGSMGSIASPTLKSAMTKHVPPDQVGQLLGSMGFLHSIMRVLCPFLINLVYAITVGTFSQVVFIVLACCLGAAFLLSLSAKNISKMPYFDL